MTVARRAQVPPFEVMEVLDRVARRRAEGRDVISLCAGEPSQGAPADVHDLAVAQHRDRLPLTYTPALGRSDLREAIAGHYDRWYGLSVDPDDVGVTTGASGAFVAVFLAAFEPGDRVAVARPGYPAYRNLLTTLGLEVVELPVGPDTGFQPTPDLLADAHAERPLRGLVLASPANPTGSMVTRDQLADLVGWCGRHDVRLVSDEIYHGITYPPGGDRGTSAWELDRRTVVVSSFSKYWGMTGWRLGWALLPEDLRGAVDALVGNAALCPPATAQAAALGAFTEASYVECDERVAAFAATRALLLDRLDDLGWGPIAPADGAFYLYAGIGDRLGPHADAGAWCRSPARGGRRGPGARRRLRPGRRRGLRPPVVRRQPRRRGRGDRPHRRLAALTADRFVH